jgi:UDP-glucose 4-epimerase
MSKPIEIIVPRLGWSMEEGAFVAWHKKDGEFVSAGEPLFSIEGDKAVQEVESIDSGKLRIAANGPKPGDSIRVGDLLGHLVGEEDVSLPADDPAPVITWKKPPQPAVEPAIEAPPRVATSPILIDKARPPAISPRALRVAEELRVDWRTVKGTGRSGRIRERDVRAAPSSLNAAPRAETSSNVRTTVLVTGGCGFIGTWVIRKLLERGLRVLILDGGERPPRWQRVIGPTSETVPLVRGSLLNRELLRHIFAEHQVTHVIHLAALLTPACQADPWEGCQANVLGSVALFEQARNSPRRLQGFSYASSMAVFDDEAQRGQTRSAETMPPTFYGAFKRAVELLAAQYWMHFRIPSLGIRPQVAYGPERDNGLTAGPSLAARAAARGEPFCIGYTGRAGYDYVEDIAEAFIRGALETPAGASVVDLLGEMVEVPEVIAVINSVLIGAAPKISASGPAIPTHAPLQRHPISALYPDWTTTSLRDGLRRTIDFYRNQDVPTQPIFAAK